MRFVWLFVVLFCWLTPLAADEDSAPNTESPVSWASEGSDGNVHIPLYFFWSLHCPHCLDARPFVEALPDHFHWIELHSLEVTQHQENARLYTELAASLGEQARSVPAFLFCGNMSTGFGDENTTGEWLIENLKGCKAYIEGDKEGDVSKAETADIEPPMIPSLPFLGQVDLQTLSLPAMTLFLAGLDSFNPCAFFILLFLLSLLVHAKSRPRMLLVGCTFVLISGLIYFLFMAAWLNVFMFSGQIRWVTLVAGIVSVLIALVNIKDYFWFKQGVSLSIPDGAKPGLFKRMRNLVNADSLPAMMLGTVVLAVVANSYELLCTAGFPMVFTRILTLNELPTGSYYGYLALYNVIYVIPLLLIVTVFSFTLGARKMSESQGRTLKLLSGLMMLGLGLLLVFAPDALNNLLTAVALLVAALVTTGLIKSLKNTNP